MTTTSASTVTLKVDSTSLDHIGMQANRFHLIGSTNFHITNNAYYDGAFKYAQAAAATKLTIQGDGTFTFDNAATGTVGANITFANIFSINSAGDASAISSLRAPIFYDLNNTAYYLDPASTSNLYTVNATNYLVTPLIYSGGGSVSFGNSVQLNANSLGFNQSGTRSWTVSASSGNLYFNSGDNSGRHIFTAGALEARIYYDYENTAYYLDPASSSALYNLSVGDGSGSNQKIEIRYGDYSAGYGAIRFYQSGTNHQTIHSFSAGWQGGTLAGTSTGAININGQNGVTFGPWNSVAGWINNTGTAQFNSDLRAPIFYDSANTGYYVDPNSVSRVVEVQSDRTYGFTDIRSPIYYDYNNTGYYLDLASTSEINKVYYNSNMVSRNYGIGQVGLYASTRYQAVFSMGEAYILPADGTSTGNLYGIAWSHPNAGGAASNLASHGMLILENGGFTGAWGGGRIVTTNDIRGTIFYDYNNTGYYCDPSGTSYINSVDARGYITSSNPWSTGNSAWFPNGITTPGVTSWMYGTVYLGNAPGNGSGTEVNSSGQVISTGAHYASIYYEYSNTGYYLDPAGTTNINILRVQGGTSEFNGITYFRTNNGGYCGSTDSAKLQAFSDSNNSAFFSFHKGGHYATNMGLDADNVIRIGGWSAAANRWQLDMSGNMTAAGDVIAYSDVRVKTNIVTVNNALEKVLKLRGVYYNRTDSDDKSRKIGVIAQEIQEVIPEVIHEQNDGLLGVSYGNLAGLFIEAMKEQQKQIDELKEIISNLVKK
jgi:hypothetical protein